MLGLKPESRSLALLGPNPRELQVHVPVMYATLGYLDPPWTQSISASAYKLSYAQSSVGVNSPLLPFLVSVSTLLLGALLSAFLQPLLALGLFVSRFDVWHLFCTLGWLEDRRYRWTSSRMRQVGNN